MNGEAEFGRNLGGGNREKINLGEKLGMPLSRDEIKKNITAIEMYVKKMRETEDIAQFLHMARLLINSNADVLYGQLKAMDEWYKCEENAEKILKAIDLVVVKKEESGEDGEGASR